MSGDLNHSPAHVVARLLIAESLGVLPTDGGDWPIFTAYEPDDPDDVISVFNTAPSLSGRLMPTGDTQQHYGIQVRVRGVDEYTAYLKVHAIERAFDGVDKKRVSIPDDVGTATSEYFIQAIHNTSGVLPIGLESATSRRRVFTLNALVDTRLANP